MALRPKARLFFITALAIFLFSLMCSVYALPDYWEGFSNSKYGRHWIADEQGLIYNSTVFTDFVTAGTQYQPIMVDINNDGLTEIITSTGNLLQAYKWNTATNKLNLVTDINLGGNIVGSPYAVFPDNETKYIVAVAGSNITLINMTGNIFNIVNTTHINLTKVQSGLMCINYSGVNACYVLGYNGTACSVIEYSLHTKKHVSYNITNSDCFDLGGTLGSKNIAPLLTDLDNNGGYDLVFPVKIGGAYEIAVWDIVSQNLKSTFGTNGITSGILTKEASGVSTLNLFGIQVENMNADFSQYEDCIETCSFLYPSWNPFNYFLRVSCENVCGINYDIGVYGGGSGNIIVFYGEDKSTGSPSVTPTFNIKIVNSVGTAVNTYSKPISPTNPINYGSDIAGTNLLYQRFYSGSDEWVFCWGYKIGGTATAGGTMFYNDGLICIDETETTLINDISSQSTSANRNIWSDGYIITGANLDTDAVFEIVSGGGLWKQNGTDGFYYQHINPVTSKTQSGGYITALADITGSGYLDICGQTTNSLYCAVTTYTNVLPTITRFRTDTGNPVCINETITISASENLGDYINDGSEDAERIIILHSNGSKYYGNFDLAEPYVSFNVGDTTGTFNLRLILQDNYNSDDESNYINYRLRVSNDDNICKVSGTDGTTATSESTTTPEQETEEIIEDFFGGFGIDLTDTMKLIFFLIVFFLVIFGASSKLAGVGSGVSTIVITAICVIGLYVGVVLGFVPVWIIVVGVISVIAVAVIILFGARGGG